LDKLEDLKKNKPSRKDSESQKKSYKNKVDKLNKKIQDLKTESKLRVESLGNNRSRLESELNELVLEQRTRIIDMINTFGSKTQFVSNKELVIEDNFINKINYIDHTIHLSKHISITSVPANGDKVAGGPITNRTFRVLKQLGGSHIVAHATPHTRSFPREGLNQAYNFITTGSLRFFKYPNRISEAYMSSASPSCILITVDEENGEFHHQRLSISLFRGDVSHKKDPHIVHDGLLFDSYMNVYEIDNSGRAVYYTDAHAPAYHKGVIGAIRELNILHKPDVIIDGGDSGHMESVCRHTEGIPGAREGLRLKDDLASIRELFDAVANSKDFPFIKQRVTVDSNHHEWLTMMVDKNPFLEGILDWETISKNMFPDWTMFIRHGDDDKGFKFGDLTIKHGDGEGSIFTAGDIYTNYLGGHSHTFMEFGNAIKTGPSCELGVKYLQNRATSWQHTITSITMYNGKTFKHPKIVLHSEKSKKSRFCYRGEIIEVNFYKNP
jgi:hypothetical protein